MKYASLPCLASMAWRQSYRIGVDSHQARLADCHSRRCSWSRGSCVGPSNPAALLPNPDCEKFVMIGALELQTDAGEIACRKPFGAKQGHDLLTGVRRLDRQNPLDHISLPIRDCVSQN